MVLGVHLVQRFGFEAGAGHRIWTWPIAVVSILTFANLALGWAGLSPYGYFSPYVAASAIVASRLCVRAGLLTALLSIVTWNFFVVPPILAFNPPKTAEVIAFTAAVVAGIWAAPRAKPKPPPQALDRKGPLPFVRRADTGNGNGKANGHTEASCWDVAASGAWAEDDNYGRQLGRIWVDHRQSRVIDTPPLAFVLQDMIRAGQFTGIEAGFANALERAAASGDEAPLIVTDAALISQDHTHDVRLEG